MILPLKIIFLLGSQKSTNITILHKIQIARIDPKIVGSYIEILILITMMPPLMFNLQELALRAQFCACTIHM